MRLSPPSPNADHPTESTPGDAATLPAGSAPNDADLDFTGTAMPPPGSGAVPLSADEKRLFARWIDLGAPVDLEGPTTEWGWMLDDLRPTLHVDAPRPGYNPGALSALRFGLADANSGVDLTTFSVQTDFLVAGPRDVLVPESGYEAARQLLSEADLLTVEAQPGSLPGIGSPARLAAWLGVAALLAFALVLLLDRASG